MKFFKIGGKEYYCDELTLYQDQEACRLLGQMGFGKLVQFWLMAVEFLSDEKNGAGTFVDKDFDIDSCLSAIAEKNLLSSLVATVVTPKGGEFDRAQIAEIEPEAGKLKRSEYMEILTDFFGKNERSLKRVLGFSGSPVAAMNNRNPSRRASKQNSN